MTCRWPAKRVFPDETAARRACWDGNMPYECPSGHGWHIGRTPASKRAALDKKIKRLPKAQWSGQKRKRW